MLILRKLAGTVALTGFLVACSQGGTTPTTTETLGEYSPQTSETVAVVAPSTITAQTTEKSAEALAYEQNIGNNLADEACITMLNIQNWVEQDRDKAVAQLKKVISLAGTYRKSAATYIADPKVLREFEDAMSKTVTDGETTMVALAALDLAGLTYIADMIETMQRANALASRHFELPLHPPCS